MDTELNIAFDIKNFKEYFIKYSIQKHTREIENGVLKDSLIFRKEPPISQKLGTFLIDFLNTDFDNKESCKEFIFKYLFINLFYDSRNKNINRLLYYIEEPSIITTHNNAATVILSVDEVKKYYDEIYTKYKDTFLEYQKLYISVCNLTYFKLLKEQFEIKKRKGYLAKFKNTITKETYHESLSSIATDITTLKINFNLEYFSTQTNNDYIIRNIPYYFSSLYFYDIVFISFRELIHAKKNIHIKKCANCNKYFIPLTAHDTKYCDSLFDGKKTCKQIGIEKSYIEKLENDKFLKKYRRRYQSLSKLVATTNKNQRATKMYEYYKKQGPIMKKKYKAGMISSEEFERWIDSTKLR